MAREAGFASAGHKLGQIVGDWYEEYFTLPLLRKLSSRLKLTLHSRFIANTQTLWKDAEGNSVDYDFVMCLPGTQTPVAFFETFWRRGARHSKDKSRDDSGKLLPMRDTYSTTRVLSIIAAGDFTAAARAFVQSRGVDLFYVAKNFIITAWKKHGAIIDYPDRIAESQKAILVNELETLLASTPEWGKKIASSLWAMPEISSQITSYTALLYSRLRAVPVEYKITVAQKSNPLTFTSYQNVDTFLASQDAQKIVVFPHMAYTYEVDFGNGDAYGRDNLTFTELQIEHQHLTTLIRHMEELP